jgi:hypothetical protein
MVTPPLPLSNDPDAIIEYLKSPLRQLYLHLDDGVSFADGTLHELDFDPHMWAHLVRFKACYGLTKVKSDEWSMGPKTPNFGIRMCREPFVLKALMTQRDGPPSPGRNIARSDFYSQYQQMTFSTALIGGEAHAANLIVDWTLDEDHKVQMALSKPAGTWLYQHAPKLEWRKLIEMGDDDDEVFGGAEEPLETGYDESEFGDGEESGLG